MGDVGGLHWGTKGWVGAATADGSWTFDHFPSIASAWRALAGCDLVLVTVPIGLPSPETGRRECDEGAKRLLGPRHPSVFYAPVREAVYETSLPAAKERNDPAGFGIQNQAWSAVPRIREVDEFLAETDGIGDAIRETHPEVCYHALADGALEHPRSTPPGNDERRSVIVEAVPAVTETLDRALAALTEPRYAPLVTDPADVLDAFVAAITARRAPDVATLPMTPPTDERGLPMAIVYPGDARQLTLGDIGDR